ncbi:hypothetical protein [Acidisoma sp. S159]|uniref:hypothetical protein n=1 Tax=Acidisoma sp. S159 TaxID=1747225 RepID=UPI00131EBBDE|nr:hypothetical protein [Acidisoma sp. S159]
MKPSSDAVASELWELVHVDKVPIRRAAARLKLSVAAAYEMLAREKLRREERVLQQPVQFSSYSLQK